MTPPFMSTSGYLRRWLWAPLLSLSLLSCQKSAPPPDLGALADFNLTDQADKPIGSQTLRGKVWAAAFMFTRCPTICPRITKQMRKLQTQAVAAEVPLTLVSISVDPDNDTPSVLREYGQRYGADFKSWSFATGDFKVIQKTSVEGFKQALDGKADPNAEGFGITHGSYLVLVDPSLHIRGYYRTNEDAELTRLLQDAKTLVP